jgi:hypothetical protein
MDNSKPMIIENAKSNEMKICSLRAVTKKLPVRTGTV